MQNRMEGIDRLVKNCYRNNNNTTIAIINVYITFIR